MRLSVAAVVGVLSLAAGASYADEPARWSAARANAWYARQAWPVGSNYIPADAINQLEMWQAATFNPARIETELGWAEGLRMTTLRVFLHNLLWDQDPRGLTRRLRVFLEIAARHHLKPIFVLFDSVWDPEPGLGPQHPPIPGVHNSGWVQSPGVALDEPAQYPRFEAYVKGMVGAFAADERILAWDLWNEPDGGVSDVYPHDPKDKAARVAVLLPQVFAWARAVHPSQPLTSGLSDGDDWSERARLSPVQQIQLDQSDILTFHNYGWPEDFAAHARSLLAYRRPVICTEYLARSAGSTIDGDLPVAKALDVGMINWGFVEGKTQTTLPWDSWRRPYVTEKPRVWFHDLLHQDGTPYRAREVQLLRTLSAAPRGVVPEKIWQPGTWPGSHL